MTETPTTRTPSVAVLGLGTMGAAMAHRIADAGMELSVWNRTAAKTDSFRDGTARIAANPADAVRDADIVLTMLFDGAAVRDTMQQALPAMRDDAVWMQSSTVGVDFTRELAQQAAAHGIGYVDAPMLGTKGPAEQGKLSALLAGDEADIVVLRPVLDSVAGHVVDTHSAPPAASGLKLAMNAWIATLTAGIAQSLTLAEAFDVDPHLVMQALDGTAMDSPYVQQKGAKMLEGDYATQFATAGLHKDLALAGESSTISPNALLNALDEVFADAPDPSEDVSSVYREFSAH